MNILQKIEFDITDNKLNVKKLFPNLANITALSYLYLYYDLSVIKENLYNKVKKLSENYPDFNMNKEIEIYLSDVKSMYKKIERELIILEIAYRQEKLNSFLTRIKMWRFSLSNYKKAINKALFAINQFEKNKLLIAEKYGKVK